MSTHGVTWLGGRRARGAMLKLAKRSILNFDVRRQASKQSEEHSEDQIDEEDEEEEGD